MFEKYVYSSSSFMYNGVQKKKKFWPYYIFAEKKHKMTISAFEFQNSFISVLPRNSNDFKSEKLKILQWFPKFFQSILMYIIFSTYTMCNLFWTGQCLDRKIKNKNKKTNFYSSSVLKFLYYFQSITESMKSFMLTV